MILLPQTPIAAAAAGQLGPTMSVRFVTRSIVVQATFLYGAGGTTTKAWVQTRVAGATWRDIMAFAFTTAAGVKWLGVEAASITAALDASDAALADNTGIAGLIGSQLRIKYTSTGTYTGATSLQLVAHLRE